MFWQLCAGLKKMLWLAPVKLSGQTYFCLNTTRVWPVNYIYLLWHISIKLNFWSIRSIKDEIWRDKAYFWPDIVCWPAVISSPDVVFNFRAKVSCITSVDGIKLWFLTWLVNWSVNLHCCWLSVSYTVSLDVIGNVDSKNKYIMNSKQKEKDDCYKVSESFVAVGIVG